MTISNNKLLIGASGGSEDVTNIEDVFDIFAYKGTEVNDTEIVNGLDLATEGGMIWIKARGYAGDNVVSDTVQGVNKHMKSNTQTDVNTGTGYVTAFNTDGFELGTQARVNNSNYNYVAWTWRRAPKFFDVVTYTGNSSNQAISHNLGSVPGMMIIKAIDKDNTNWSVFHRKLDGGTAPEDYVVYINSDAEEVSTTTHWNRTAPTSTHFTVGANGHTNSNGKNYIAYLFAHETDADSLIQCGSIEGNSNDFREIDLGWEPQFIMLKRRESNSGGSWFIFDDRRNLLSGGADNYLRWNTNNAEDADQQYVTPTAKGFQVGVKGDGDGSYFNQNSRSYLYMAIRRENMATITNARSVYKTLVNVGNGQGGVERTGVGFSPDLVIGNPTGGDNVFLDMTRGIGSRLSSGDNAGEQDEAYIALMRMDGFLIGDNAGTFNSGDDAGSISYNFKRAKGFFDIVNYTGTGSARTVDHGLGVAPEMMWVKRRDGTGQWAVYHSGTDSSPAEKYLHLNLTNAVADATTPWNDTAPTDSVFTVGAAGGSTNDNNEIFIAYLFATLAGVSKVGSVVHSGSSTDVDCGFAAGATFVMLKRMDATGDWFVWTSERGIVSGNDPYKVWNTSGAEVTNTDFLDPLSSGFQITGDFTDGTYMFYAIA